LASDICQRLSIYFRGGYVFVSISGGEKKKKKKKFELLSGVKKNVRNLFQGLKKKKKKKKISTYLWG
jgi:hypothetical protein